MGGLYYPQPKRIPLLRSYPDGRPRWKPGSALDWGGDLHLSGSWESTGSRDVQEGFWEMVQSLGSGPFTFGLNLRGWKGFLNESEKKGGLERVQEL